MAEVEKKVAILDEGHLLFPEMSGESKELLKKLKEYGKPPGYKSQTINLKWQSIDLLKELIFREKDPKQLLFLSKTLTRLLED